MKTVKILCVMVCIVFVMSFNAAGQETVYEAEDVLVNGPLSTEPSDTNNQYEDYEGWGDDSGSSLILSVNESVAEADAVHLRFTELLASRTYDVYADVRYPSVDGTGIFGLDPLFVWDYSYTSAAEAVGESPLTFGEADAVEVLFSGGGGNVEVRFQMASTVSDGSGNINIYCGNKTHKLIPGLYYSGFDRIVLVPPMASDPEPADGIDHVNPFDVQLNWQGPEDSVDPDYELYFPEGPDPNFANAVAIPVDEPPYDAGNLSLDTEYYWRVDTIEPNEGAPIILAGQVWSFTTGGKATDPNPSDGSIAAPVVLSWTGDTFATAYDVYFSSDVNDVGDAVPAAYLGEVTDTNTSALTLPALGVRTTYYWRVDEKDEGGVLVSGDVWSFTTLVMEAHWKFDETSGKTAIDETGSHDATLKNGPEWDIGILGGALRFDGIDDYVDPGNIIGDWLQGSVSAWVNFDSTVWGENATAIYSIGNQPIIGGGDNAMFGAHPNPNYGGGSLVFGAYIPGLDWQLADSGMVPETGNWYHVVGTWGADGISIYVNGQLSGTNNYNGAFIGSSYNTIGCNSWPYSVVEGRLDDIRIYDGAISAESVAQLYEASPQAKYPDPADGAQGVDKETLLTWVAGAGALTHDVYLGTNRTLVSIATTDSDEFMANTTDTSYTPDSLNNGTTYYWRIDELLDSGLVTGNIWSFTTESLGCNPPLEADINNDCIVNMTDLAVVAGEWLRCSLVPDTLCP